MEPERNDVFQPLSVRMGWEPPFRLVEGIPPHSGPALVEWCRDVFWNKRYPDELCDAVCSLLRLPEPTRDYRTLINGIARSEDPTLFLNLLDYLVRVAGQERQKRLGRLLYAGGSAWTVKDPEDGIVRRVPAENEATYERALERSDGAASRLSDAWHAMFSLHQDLDKAWNESIRAVESAYGPIIVPEGRQRIGIIVRDLEQARPEKFQIRLVGDDPKGTLLGMLRAVPYQSDRHGPPGSELDPVAIEGIVYQAAALVALAADDVITMNSTP